MNEEVQEVEAVEVLPMVPVPANATPMQLMAVAVQNGADMDTLERLTALAERFEAREAKKEFFKALAKFQEMVPELVKTKRVQFQNVDYSYAPLSSIIKQVKDPLKKCGFAYRWEFGDDGGEMWADFILTHKSGHSERTRAKSPLDTSGSKNPVQSRGSTQSYLQRYSMVGGLGLATADDDTDGRGGIQEREFNREDVLWFGAHKDVHTWKSAPQKYLENLVLQTDKNSGEPTIYAKFAQQELSARDHEAPPVNDDIADRISLANEKLGDEVFQAVEEEWLAACGIEYPTEATYEQNVMFLNMLRDQAKLNKQQSLV